MVGGLMLFFGGVFWVSAPAELLPAPGARQHGGPDGVSAWHLGLVEACEEARAHVIVRAAASPGV